MDSHQSMRANKTRKFVSIKLREHSWNLSLLKNLQQRKLLYPNHKRHRSSSAELMQLLRKIHRLENKLVLSRQHINEMLESLIVRDGETSLI